MNFDEDKLRSIWKEQNPSSNEDAALKKVLATSSNLTAVKDVTSLFVGWAWVVFLGFGASMYSAKRKFELHKQQQRKTANLTLQQNKNVTGELE